MAFLLFTEVRFQLQEVSFYRVHIGGLNLPSKTIDYLDSAGPFMRRFPSRAGPFMRAAPSLSGTVYAWISRMLPQLSTDFDRQKRAT